MKKVILFINIILFVSCQDKTEKIKPTISFISQSIYASGFLKSKNQYEVYSNVNGIINTVFVAEGDSIKNGAPILSISNDVQKLNALNAELASNFYNLNSNKGKLNDALSSVRLFKDRLKNDSTLYYRQVNLWQQQVGTKTDLEQRGLTYESSKTAYQSSIIKYNDLKSQINFTASQSKNNLAITTQAANDFIIKSNIDGIVYSFKKIKGENVGIQTPLAIIGDAKIFILEMQVDEYDILNVKIGLPVLVTLESYQKKVLNAVVTKIDPLMNEQSRTFLVEAEFINPPNVLYPNLTFEANIVVKTKQKALLIPRDYLLQDSLVIKNKHDTVVVKTGLQDYKKVEIIFGIDVNDELVKPMQ